MEEVLPHLRRGVFAQRIFLPGHVNISQDIEIIPADRNAAQDRFIAGTITAFAPYLEHIEVGIAKYEAVPGRGRSLFFQPELPRCYSQQIAFRIGADQALQVSPGVFIGKCGTEAFGQLPGKRAFARGFGADNNNSFYLIVQWALIVFR